MHPEDRVLVGVIKRKKDLDIAREQHWYRIPQGKAERGLFTEYLAFFLGFGKQKGVYYYARRTGAELATRAQLLPEEAHHPRADEVYHKIQFSELIAKVPPILNSTKRRFSFIYTTWDRFVHAQEIDDLYSRADYLVDRVYYALRDEGFRPLRSWELEYPPYQPQVRVLCEQGEVVASPGQETELTIDDNIQATVDQMKQAIEKRGGPIMLPLPVE